MGKIKGSRASLIVRRYLYKILKINGIERINGKVLSSTSTPVLVENYNVVTGKNISTHKKELKKQILREIKTEAPENKANLTGGYVYIFGNIDEDICKIGYSKNPEQRILSIQTGCPFKLSILLTVAGTFLDEREIHKKCNKYKLHGEWFQYSLIKNSIEGILK